MSFITVCINCKCLPTGLDRLFDFPLIIDPTLLASAAHLVLAGVVGKGLDDPGPGREVYPLSPVVSYSLFSQLRTCTRQRI